MNRISPLVLKAWWGRASGYHIEAYMIATITTELYTETVKIIGSIAEAIVLSGKESDKVSSTK